MHILKTSAFRLFCQQCLKARTPAVCFSPSRHMSADIQQQSSHQPDLIEGDAGKQKLPLITNRKLDFFPKHREPLQGWLETLSTIEDKKLGLLDLHPDIFGIIPKIDVLHDNVQWQMRYRHINYRKVRNRAEMPGGGRKPWPQKGTGRARHGSIRSPLWIGGGACFGPRGPTSFYYLLSTGTRVLGLQSALSAKFAQNYLHVVDSLDLPTDDPKYLESLIESRGWGLSVLFVDNTDYISKNMALATNAIKQYNVMPVYGLNVYSMLKHETLVLTLPALEQIEHKLLKQMHQAKRQRSTSVSEMR